ncbi:MAG: TonB-dependent receptor [Cellvibrionaceae bacterium]|nr:TonB-dependent receptor [Cellvibrionaceae bacterium]
MANLPLLCPANKNAYLTIFAQRHWFVSAFICIQSMSFSVHAAGQEKDAAKVNEEQVLVVGSQIKGSSIRDALAVSIIDMQQIEDLGVADAAELMALMPEQGQDFFSEAENFSGGINSSRGDIGAYNLRSLGTGNTLVLLNGRRLVNAASYQTEEVGGSFVPVNTVNAKTIPAGAFSRLEILRDGASTIYGADAVAGVVNNVMRTDYDGLTLRVRYQTYDHFPRDDYTLSLTWGGDFNEGNTQVATFLSYYDRDPVSASDEARWAESDIMYRVPEDSPWFGDTVFRNSSINSIYGQYDLVSSALSAGLSGVLTDSAGEFETYPSGSDECQWELGYGTCGAIDGQGTVRYNSNAYRDLVSQLSRSNFFSAITHDFSDFLQSFSELMYYQSDTRQRNDAETSFTAVKLRVGASNYYNPFGPCGSPNRLPETLIGSDVPCAGLALIIDNYRYADAPLLTEAEGRTWRILQGLRGSFNKFDWESALSWSKATSKDVTDGIPANSLLQEALLDATPAAYNPFSGGVNSNIERALVSVTRRNETELKTFDARISSAALFSLPTGKVGFVSGIELRQESFVDDRDPRHDGTIQFTDWEDDTFPIVSDIVGSSPTADSEGSRDVFSSFLEFQLPLHSTLDVQLAARYENFSDTDDATVGKVAFGWQPIEQLLLRGSWSEAFRVPNLVTVNEEEVVRANTRTDWVCVYAAENGGDPEQDELDCSNSTQRTAEGSEDLVPEESENTSLGLALQPFDFFTLTVDYWSIKKENTIGLVGEENHSLLDLVARLEAGTASCASFTGNPVLERDDINPDLSQFYSNAGICPAGTLSRVNDRYANLDTRTLEGHDIGLYLTRQTQLGDFRLSYNLSVLDKFEQQAGGQTAALVTAQQDGTLPVNYPVEGFSDLIGRDGAQKQRESLRFSWNKGAFGASISGFKVGSFYQSSLTLEDDNGDELRYVIPAMTTWNASFRYRLQLAGADHRVLLGIKNFTDARAPLADRYFGYLSDAHSDLGVHYFLDWQVEF